MPEPVRFVDSMTLVGGQDGQMSPSELQVAIKSIDEQLDELIAKTEALKEERAVLAAQLEAQSKRYSIPPLELGTSRISEYASLEEQAGFLIDLFSPRRDVHAVRRIYYSSKKDAWCTSYYPPCENYKRRGCAKAVSLGARTISDASPCSKCTMKAYQPLDVDKIINKHLENTDNDGVGAIGIYPLKDGNLTRFILIDLDEKNWEKDARAILHTARNMGVSMAWERSFSGRGAHLWVFFSEDVPVAEARRLMFIIIDKARESHSGLSISSYDRLIPSQDGLVNGGIGSLVLMPFVLSAAGRSCTVFLDDNGVAYPLYRQFPYLSSVHRHDAVELKRLIATNENKIGFKLEALDKDMLNPSWAKRLPKLTKEDVKAPVVLYLSTGVSVDKKALSEKAIEGLRRLALVSNPEHYKELARMDGRAHTPACIPVSRENHRVLCLPRALRPVMEAYLSASGIPYTIEDHRHTTRGLDATFKAVLRKDQVLAFDAMMDNEIGVLALPPGSGKTVIALAIAAARAEATLVITPSDLVPQWKERAVEMLEIHNQPSLGKWKRKSGSYPVGEFVGSKKHLYGVFDIASIETLASRVKDGKDLELPSYGLVIVDECHGIAASNFRNVMSVLNSKYVYGLTATVKRADGLERLMHVEIGPVVYSMESAALARERGIMQYFVPHYLETAPPGKSGHIRFSELLNQLAEDWTRNAQIADDIAEAYHDGRNIIVFTRRVKQNNAIAQCLDARLIPCIVMESGMRDSERAGLLDDVRRKEHAPVIIATDQLLGEGVDIPNMDTLFLASPYMQERVMVQCAGRIARQWEGKQETRIHDYVDFLIPCMDHMFSRRVREYRRMGYIEKGGVGRPSVRQLYHEDDFIECLIADLSKAISSIVISSPFPVASKSSARILESAVEAMERGVEFELRLSYSRLSEAAAARTKALLLRLGIKAVELEHALAFVVIDESISWYGELDVMSLSQKNTATAVHGGVLRIVDNRPAKALLEDDNLLVRGC